MALEHQENGASASAVVWHDLECGSYDADLELWRELAEDPQPRGAILEVGAGSGRVCLDLARRGHELTAIDNDAALLGALRERAGTLPVVAVEADARDFRLERSDFALCLMPMQTLQLLGGSQGRLAFMRRARAHLRAGGLLACAVVTELEPFDRAFESVRPSAEVARVGDRVYRSEAVSVRTSRRGAVIERDRLILPAADGRGSARAGAARHAIELDRVSARQLAREGARAGLQPAGTRTVPATDEHVASLVVMFAA